MRFLTELLTGSGHRAVRSRRGRQREQHSVVGQGVRGGVPGRRQRQRAAVHERRVHRPVARERHGRRPRDNRPGRGPGHRPVRQRPVHGCVGLQEFVIGAGLADRPNNRVQRQSRVRPRGIRG